MTVVVDTSVTVAWYFEESFSLPAREWHQRLLDGRVRAIVPGLHYLEFANVLRTYVSRRELTREQAESIFALHLDAPLDLVDPPLAAVLPIALAFSATAYDATFISLAKAHDCSLVTAERTTTPWVVKLGKQVVTIG